MIQLKKVIKNRYKIVQRIGQGGFGETFEVDDKGKPKVIKILNTFTDPEKQQKALSLFQREAAVLMKLHHAGIPKAEPDGYFTWQDGVDNCHCLVMEKIEGQTLQKWLEDNRDKITEKLAIDWLKQMLLILEYVHQQGYIHRDINPSNIMVNPNGKLVLIDFGCAREISSTYLAKLVDDVKGTQLFTPGYTPREQIEGKPVPQSDFFALGRTFVELLTGICPKQLPEDNLTGNLIWRDRASTFSQQLANLIDKMMAVFLSERPQNTKEIWHYLQTLETGLPMNFSMAIEIASQLDRGQDTAHINQKSIKVKIAVAIGVIFLGSIGFHLASPQVAIAINKFGIKTHDKKPEIAQISYKLAIWLKPDFGKAYYNLGSLYEEQQKLELAIEAYRMAIAMQPDFVPPYNNLARLYIRDKKYAAATTMIETYLPQQQSDEVRYALHKNLGWALLEQRRLAEAKNHIQKAIGLYGDRAAPYCLMSQILKSEGDKQPAKVLWENCRRNAHNDKSPEVLEWINIAP